MSAHLILVVEEDAATRAFLADQLAADGYEIALAENRRHALLLLATRRPQLVLADKRPTLGLLDAVRTGEGLAGEIDPTTPMIVLTARADELARVSDGPRGRARAGVGVRPRRRQRRQQAVLLPRAARADRSAAAPSLRAAPYPGRPGRRAHARSPHARGASAGGKSSSRASMEIAQTREPPAISCKRQWRPIEPGRGLRLAHDLHALARAIESHRLIGDIATDTGAPPATPPAATPSPSSAPAATAT